MSERGRAVVGLLSPPLLAQRSQTPQLKPPSILSLPQRARSASPAIGTTKFHQRVAFDTFENKEATDLSLTLRSKHSDYAYTRLSRTFLIGVDTDKYSEAALEWLLDELVEDGDEVICLRAIDPSLSASYHGRRAYLHEAQRFLRFLVSKNSLGKKISLVLEFPVGKVESLIQRMIQIYEPAILIVGTRGRSMEGFRGLLPGSVSKYCLQHSPVPVVVVRPSHKLAKRRAKREADPTRRVYRELLLPKTSDSTKLYLDGSTGDKLPPRLPAYLQLTETEAKNLLSPSHSRGSTRPSTPVVK